MSVLWIERGRDQEFHLILTELELIKVGKSSRLYGVTWYYSTDPLTVTKKLCSAKWCKADREWQILYVLTYVYVWKKNSTMELVLARPQSKTELKGLLEAKLSLKPNLLNFWNGYIWYIFWTWVCITELAIKKIKSSPSKKHKQSMMYIV